MQTPSPKNNRSKLAVLTAGLFFVGPWFQPATSRAQTQAGSHSSNGPQAADIIDASTGVNAHTNLHLDPGNATAARPMLWQINPQSPNQPPAGGIRFFQSHTYLYTAPGFSAWVRRPDVVFRQDRRDETLQPLVPSLGADVVYNLSDPTPLNVRQAPAPDNRSGAKPVSENQAVFSPLASQTRPAEKVDTPAEPSLEEIMQALKQRNRFMLRSVAQSVAQACQAIASE